METGSYEISVSRAGYLPYNQTVIICGNTSHPIRLATSQSVYGSKTYSGYGPDPVNTATGNFIYQKRDLTISGRGLSFSLERNYNSQDGGNHGPLGFGWRHSYQVAVTENADTSVTIRWGDGKTETWTPDGSGGYTAQYGVFDTLTKNGDGTFSLKKKDQTRYNFNGSGKLVSIVDKNDNTLALTYTGDNLTRITDTVGRTITFPMMPTTALPRSSTQLGERSNTPTTPMAT